MIKSMTGFGKAEGVIGNRKFTVEVRSLNSKQLDVNLRMPGLYKEKEMDLRNSIAGSIVRGKIDLTIYYESGGIEKKVSINKSLLTSYYDDLKELAEQIGQENVDYMSLLMRIPDALKPESQEFDEDEWNQVLPMINAAIDGLNAYRLNEGKVLEHDFIQRVQTIKQLLKDIAQPAKDRIEKIKDRISGNLNELADKESLDQNRFEQELIYYLEKIDITEEQVRLESNCNHFLETLSAETSQGKKLGFICQEIGREINTIGSKANDAGIQRHVVQMKDELEKIKEQVLNVL